MSSSLNNESDVSLDSKDEQLVQQSYKPDCNEPTHSPPSSSPVVKMERQDVKPSKPSFSRKRSHEDMSTALQPQKTDPETAVEETKPTSANEQQTGKKSQDSNGAMASAAAHTMPPPTTPGAMAPPSIKPQRSRQGSETATHSGKTTNGAGGPYETQHQTDTSDEDPTSDDIKMCDTPATGEPRDPIEDFHWQDLEQRYHDKINELCTEEHQIMMEFDSLCNYFATWAQAGADREVDRSYKRLKTQMTFVQHEEDELEQKRLHYIKVVEAFKSALSLLSA